MAMIKANKEKRGLYITVDGRRFKIPYRDMRMFREMVVWRLGHADAKPKYNFKGFSIELARSTSLKTKMTVFTPRREYTGTILDMTLSSL